jgi:hypothetical protein
MNKNKTIFLLNENLDINAELLEISTLIKNKSFSNKQNLGPLILEIRRKILDWLLTVCKKLNLRDQTYFITIDLLDRLMEDSEVNHEEIHLYAVVCLILATKFEEIVILDFIFASENICQNVFSQKKLQEAEKLVINALKMRIGKNYFEDFSFLLISKLSETNLIPMSTKTLIYNKSLFVYKLILQDYNYYRGKSMITLYCAIIFFCLNTKIQSKENDFIYRNSDLLKCLESIGIKMKHILLYSEEIEKLTDVFFDSNIKSESNIFKVEYLSLIRSC